MEYTDLIIEKKYPIGYITINRPEKRNALTTFQGGSIEQLQQAGLEMRDDRDVRVFIIKGAGDCFCSGFDMSRYDENVWKAQEDLPKGFEWIDKVRDEPWTRFVRARSGDLSTPESASLGINRSCNMFQESYWENPKPSIAQVDSFCLGAGLWLINNCDVVFATPDAVFAYPPIRYGASITPWILPPWLLGRRRVLDMALTGRFITAQEAYDCGLITKIVVKDNMEEEVRKMAESIARVPPATNLFSKMAINSYYEGLGINEFSRLAIALCLMTENSAVPGHYFDFFELVRTKGFTQAYKEQREKWGYPDPVLEKEVARLKTKKAEGN
jgi:enoyl-CoA hydratase